MNVKFIFIIISIMFSHNLFAQYNIRYDWKTSQVVGENNASAISLESQYRDEQEKQKKKRESILTKVTVRNLVKSADLAARQNVGDFNRQSSTFIMLCNEITKLGLSLNKMLTEGGKHPSKTIYCYKTATKVFIQAENIVDKTIYIAMGAKVPNPFENLSFENLRNGTIKIGTTNAINSSKKNDGMNLLMADDRVNICNETIFELRRLRRMCDIISLKLRCDYRWNDLIKEAAPYDYYWALTMTTGFEKVKNDINNFPLK